jgi:hypothetical protein
MNCPYKLPVILYSSGIPPSAENPSYKDYKSPTEKEPHQNDNYSKYQQEQKFFHRLPQIRLLRLKILDLW